MSSPSTSTSTTHDIANRLVFQLLLIGFVTLILSLIAYVVASPLGPLAYVAVAIVTVPALWLVIHAVFAAFDDLLESKLEDEERAS